MFKIISAEIKKILSKPGVYILSVLLAIILVLGVLIYEPKVYESSQYELTGNTFVEKYNDFIGGGQIDTGKKAEAQTNLNNAINSINNYSVLYLGEYYTQQEHICNLLNKCEELFNAYQDCSTDNSHQDYINTIRNNLVSSFETLNESIENALINSQYGSYSILTTNVNYDNYKSAYKLVIAWAKVAIEKENLKNHIIEFENNYSKNFYTTINNFKYPTLSADFIKTYTNSMGETRLAILNERLSLINNEIKTNYELALVDNDFNLKYVDKMDELANLYTNTINTYNSLIKYELICNAFNTISTKDELKIMHLSEHSNFNSNSLLKRFEYLFEHNKSETDFGKPLTIGITSNFEINTYDYSYFILRAFSFVIIIYAIMSCCHSIAGEIKEGSMRYLAIRPVTRTKMFFGKWLAVLIISIILTIFSLIISLCVGGAVYGFNSMPILTIFNGNIAFTTHPIGMILIYIISMLFELIIYSLIAMLLSCLFKSDLVSMTILLVLYLLNTLLPVFVQGSNTWLAYYPFSHISFYSLFGSSVYSVQGNFFNLIFGAKTYAGTHVALTISLITIIISLTGFIAVRIFKNKEL